MKLRPYQRAAIDAIRAEWDAGEPNALLVLPTGCGKTACFTFLGAEMRAEGIRKILLLAHMDKLLEQAREKWLGVEPGALVGIYQGARREQWADVICASVQSCYPDQVDEAGNVTRKGRIRELPLAEIDLVIVDECHRGVSDSYVAIISAVRAANPAALMLGVTATPGRADMKSLGLFFKLAAYHYPLQEAIDEGYLAPLRGKRCDIDIDLSTVKTSRDSGDYQDADLGKAMDHPQIHEAIAKKWLDELGPGTEEGGPFGRFTVTYSPTIAAAEGLSAAFAALGVETAVVHGRLSKKTCDAVLARFQAKLIRVLCNVAKLTEGWDAQHIGCVVVARPTKSGGLYRQIVGRGTRLLGATMEESVVNGKRDCIILDCVGANALGLQTLLDLSAPDAEKTGLEPEEDEEAEEKAEKELSLLPTEPEHIKIRGVTVYDVDLFGGQVNWVLIRGMRVAILDIGVHVVLYREPSSAGFTALLIDDTGAIPLAKARPEREALISAEQVCLTRGRAKFLKPGGYTQRMPATERQVLQVRRLVQQNLELGGDFDARDVPQSMSLPQAMAWIAYLKTRRMWIRHRMARRAA